MQIVQHIIACENRNLIFFLVFFFSFFFFYNSHATSDRKRILTCCFLGFIFLFLDPWCDVFGEYSSCHYHYPSNTLSWFQNALFEISLRSLHWHNGYKCLTCAVVTVSLFSMWKSDSLFLLTVFIFIFRLWSFIGDGEKHTQNSFHCKDSWIVCEN